MSRHRLSASDGEGFLRAFTELWAEIEAHYRVEVTCDIRPSNRKGLIIITLASWRIGAAREGGPVARYSVEYPTAAISTLEGWMYASLNKLDRMLMDKLAWPAGRA